MIPSRSSLRTAGPVADAPRSHLSEEHGVGDGTSDPSPGAHGSARTTVAVDPSDERLWLAFRASDLVQTFALTVELFRRHRTAIADMLDAADRAIEEGHDPVVAARRSWVGPQAGISERGWSAHTAEVRRMLEAAGIPVRADHGA